MRARFEAGDIETRYAGPGSLTIGLYRRWLRLKDALLGTHSALPPNAPRLVDALMRVHGTQLLRDGLFNADPHGGKCVARQNDRRSLAISLRVPLSVHGCSAF